MKLFFLLLLSVLVALAVLPAGAAPPEREPLAFRVPAKMSDAAEVLPPSRVRMDGYLGQRVANNEKARLLQVNEEELLEGFRHRPGKQAWIGEHVGKWLHAATLAWAYTGDPKLREKIDRVATELIKTQE